MNLRQWSKGNADYGRRLLQSGLDGARSGRQEFLHGAPVAPFLSESVRHALGPAVIGACIAMLGSYPGSGRPEKRKLFAYGLLGAAVGLGAGLAWRCRRLTESMASGAAKGIGKVRDEHWLERHPIDYA